jgi:hypothetical protein
VAVKVSLAKQMTDRLSGKRYDSSFELKPYGLLWLNDIHAKQLPIKNTSLQYEPLLKT